MSPPTNNHLKGGIRNDGGRAERLAQELRSNLKRRKARDRALAARDAVADRAADADPQTDTGSVDGSDQS